MTSYDHDQSIAMEEHFFPGAPSKPTEAPDEWVATYLWRRMTRDLWESLTAEQQEDVRQALMGSWWVMEYTGEGVEP